ncbi:MAG: hypothetical protein WAS26_02820 [Paracoccaceae bacterium]
MQDELAARRRLLAVGLVTFVLMGFGQALFGPALPVLTRLFLLAEGQSAVLISALWIGSALGVGSTYGFGQRAQPRHVLGLLALGAAMMAVQPGWAVMLLGALVFGTGFGLATATFNPRVLKAFGPRGASMLSLLNAAFAAGAIAAPLIFVGLGSASALAFAMTAALCAAIWLFAGEKAGAPASGAPPVRSGFRIHWPIMAFGAIGIGIEASLIGLGPTALVTAGETETAAARLLSGFFVAFLLARVVLGVMAHRVPSFALYLAAMAWAALAALVAVLWAPGPAFVALGISCGMFFPGFFVTAARKMGDDPRVTPVILSAGLVGGISMPLVLSALSAGMGERGFFWLLLCLTVPASLAALLALRGMAR